MNENGDSAALGRGVPGNVQAGASIRVMKGFYEGLELPMDQDWLVVGRGRSADLVLADATISRAHAAIGFNGEAFYVQDLGSTNGTRVNGKRAPQAELHDGDEVRLGKLQLRITLPS
jgi:pSer/pThr/pTyr-binding forkhead associated (FHA) protein